MRALSTFACLLACALPCAAQRDFSQVQVQAQPAGGTVHMLEGAGGNVAVSAGPDGVLMVDSQFAELRERLLAAIAGVTSVHDLHVWAMSTAEPALTAFIDRWIYVFMAVMLIALVLIGFVPDSLQIIAAVEAGQRRQRIVESVSAPGLLRSLFKQLVAKMRAVAPQPVASSPSLCDGDADLLDLPDAWLSRRRA